MRRAGCRLFTTIAQNVQSSYAPVVPVPGGRRDPNGSPGWLPGIAKMNYLSPEHPFRPRVCAVSYLNTVPLVWGMLHGRADARECSICRSPCRRIAPISWRRGEADIGIVPVIEMARQKLEYFRGTGIACHGPVRSILLISKVPFREIRDAGDRFRLAHLGDAVARDPGGEIRRGAEADLASRPIWMPCWAKPTPRC